MKERPILFSGPMVRAILDGRKTQTRRPVKFSWSGTADALMRQAAFDPAYKCHIGQPGDRLWVRETWRMDALGTAVEYRATTSALMEYIAPWRPSIHMPRWASRITLEITRVWVERVQEITKEGAKADGCCGGHGSIPGYAFSATPREHFRHIWQSLYGTWDANPWVWAIEFRRTR